jgi:hypothetical protein
MILAHRSSALAFPATRMSMQRVLVYLRLRHPQQDQPGADSGSVMQPGAVIRLVAGVAILLEPFLSGREWSRRRLILISQRQLPDAARRGGFAQCVLVPRLRQPRTKLGTASACDRRCTLDAP